MVRKIIEGVVGGMLAVLMMCPAISKAEAVRIVATQKGFDAPRTISAGMRHIVFENHSDGIHEAMFVKLVDGMTVQGFNDQLKNGILFPKGALDYSGPGLTSPGQATELWLRLDPGDYVLICWNHTRTSVQPLTVRATGEKDELPPKEDVVLKLIDFKFVIEGRIKKGMQVIRIETPGPTIHEADLFLLHPGHTVTDVNRWYKEDDLEGAAPADALGGVLDSSNIKNVVWLRRSFTKGTYVLHCAEPMNMNAKSGEHGPIHADVGMVATFQVE